MRVVAAEPFYVSISKLLRLCAASLTPEHLAASVRSRPFPFRRHSPFSLPVIRRISPLSLPSSAAFSFAAFFGDLLFRCRFLRRPSPLPLPSSAILFSFAAYFGGILLFRCAAEHLAALSIIAVDHPAALHPNHPRGACYRISSSCGTTISLRPCCGRCNQYCFAAFGPLSPPWLASTPLLLLSALGSCATTTTTSYYGTLVLCRRRRRISILPA